MRRAAVTAAIALLAFGCATADPLAPGATTAPAAAPAGVEVDDLFRLGWISELVVAPDGASAFYVWQSADRAADGYASRLHRLALDGSGATAPLTAAGVDASKVALSRDGRFLAWLESAAGKSALRWAPLTARGLGDATTAIALDEEIEGFDWAPDGERFVIVRADPARDGEKSSDPKWVTRALARRDGEGFLDERRTHLWIVERRAAKRPPRQLTAGAWDDGSPAWSPDGRRIAFVSNRAADPDATDDTDIFVVSPDAASGSDVAALVTGPGADSDPAWSHRGDRLAFLSLRRADDFYQPHRVLTIAAGGGEPLDLTGDLDAWVAGDCMPAGAGPRAPLWSADDRELVVPFERRGATWIGVVDSVSGEAREAAGGRYVHGLARELPSGDLLFTRTDPTHPPELHRTRRGGGEAERLTRFYDRWLAERRLVSPEKVVATNSDGDEVEAWLYPPLAPLGSAPKERSPLIVYIHGGPQGFDGDYFDFDLENQLFPARGWGVLRVNYRGSTSYGERYSRAIWGDWHSREHEDLMAALDRAIATHAWIDADRLGIGGWSYGGIMTLWTVGHTDRFRVGVPERLSFDYLSLFGEDQWFTWYLTELGSPLENAELYRRLSPGTYLPNVRTPLYLIANEHDFNCPLSQALQLYQRLKLMGQKTELVVYPGASHSMSRPSHFADRLRRLIDWFGRHLND